MKRFGEAIKDISAENQTRFYRDNFIDLMGQGLDHSLHDHPSQRSMQ
jgi:hypothetical protein